jgi:2-hydroxychromene-2-carboxylate isomerase
VAGNQKVHFYYSVGSRYSYLASTQLDALERQTGCEVLWHPLYSVDLYRLRGANPFEGEPISGQYDWDWRRKDAERWAAYYGVPYKEPRGAVEFDPRLLARACVAAGMLGAVRPYSRALFGAIFAEGVPRIDEEECALRAEAVGLERDRFLGWLDSSETKERLEQNARRARSAGAFGVPTFVIGNEIFWGNDRLVLVRHRLEELADRA